MLSRGGAPVDDLLYERLSMIYVSSRIWVGMRRARVDEAPFRNSRQASGVIWVHLYKRAMITITHKCNIHNAISNMLCAINFLYV